MKSEFDDHDDPASHLDAFSKVVAAMKDLDRNARLRLFLALATFFDLPISGTHARASEGPATLSPGPAPTKFSEDRSASPKQFLFEKSPNTDVERVACLAYYLTHYRDTPYFKTLDISKLNTEAAQTKFSNPAHAVDNSTKAGLLVPATKGQKQLSAIGERYVEALPDRSAAREAVSRAKPRRSRTKNKASAVDDE